MCSCAPMLLMDLSYHTDHPAKPSLHDIHDPQHMSHVTMHDSCIKYYQKMMHEYA
jgi:hypothetical protein